MVRASWLRVLFQTSEVFKTSQGCRRRRRLHLEVLEARDVPSFNQLALDFDTATSPTAPGFTRVATPYYTAARGYGFKNNGTITAIDRGTADPLTRDFHQGRNETFNANMNKGWYVVTLYMGDAAAARKALQVNAEGAYAVTVPATSAGQFVVSRFVVELKDTQLNIRFLGGWNSKFALDGMTIVPWTLSANAGPDASIDEGTAFQFQGSASGQGPLTYSWNFGDGTTSSGTLTPTKTYTDQGKFTVTLTVTDAYGFQRSDSAVVTAGNVAPSAAIANSGPVAEGSSATVSLSDPTDPSSADVAAGFKYSFDFDNNGAFEVADSTNASATVPASYLADGPGTRTVRARISDKDGGFTDYTTDITINNVAPSASFTATASSTNDKTVNFASSVSDPGTADTFTYAWDFGDGAVSNLASPAHTYAQYGTYTVQLTVTDKDGASVSTSMDVKVEAADTTAPTVSITSPANNATVSATVNVQADASDNVGVVGVQFFLDGQALGAEDTASPYAVSWNTTQVSNGSHSLTAKARDAAGNVATTSAINVTVSNTTPAPEGLVAAYGFNEGAGTTLGDSSGSNNGTISGAAWVANGQFGKALSFDGVNDWVTINDAAALDLTTGMTLEAWVKPSTINGWETVVLKEDANELAYALYADNNGNDSGGPRRPALSIRQGSTTHFTSGSSQLQVNTWTHLAATYDGAVARFYVNGALASSLNRSGSINTTNNPLRIGGNSVWSEWFNGLIDEVRIYNRALSASEIQNDMNTPVESPAPDTTAPTVTAVSPANGATGVNVAASVQVTFSEAMDASTINGNQIQLRDSSGDVVASGVTYNSGNFVATLDPNANLAYSASYTVSVQGVKDVAGNALAAAFSSSFTTAAAPPQDTTPPTVTAVNPANGASGVNTGVSVLISFSEAMDTSTINGNQIQLRDSAGNVVASAVTYNSGNFAATLDPNANLAYSSSYTVSIQAVKDVAGNVLAATFSSSFTTGAAPVPSGDFIVTPYDKIPNFGANPTIVSAGSGTWSNPGTWSTGSVPGANDVVSIAAGTTVTFDVVMTAASAVKTIVIQAGGKLAFRTDISTTLYVSNFLVLADGELVVGTQANPVAAGIKAQIIFPNKALDTNFDPEQYGNGLIALGKVTMVGATLPNTFSRLATEPRAGQTTVTLAQPATGWQVGDKVVIPDTRHLRESERSSNYVPQWEFLTISAISANALTVNLSTPLVYDHFGARDADGTLEFLPHVVNVSRNVVVKSESATGNRGHVMFSYRADINVQYVQFSGLGRTKDGADDNTTFDANGRVTHLGANQEDRNSVQFRHLFGPISPQANGYQYTFVGNSVFCPLNPMPFVWGINVNDSHYGLIKDNVLYNWAGAAFVTKTGSETGNVIEHNMVVRTNGSSIRADDFARAGNGFWFRGPNNIVRDNVAANINGGGWDVYTYGFNVYATYLGTVNVPAFQGADLSQVGQRVSTDMNATPLREFAGNEVYGATMGGMTLWWLGAFGETVKGDAGVAKDFRVWHHSVYGAFLYESNNLVIDGFVARGNVDVVSNPFEGALGIWSADYMTRGLLIKNANIQGLATGIMTPTHVGRGLPGSTTTIQDSYLSNVTNVSISPPRSVNGSGGLSPKTTLIRNVTFAHPAAINTSRWTDISMDDVTSDSLGTSNRSVADLVFVYDFNGDSDDDFQVFYTNRSPADAVTRAFIDGKVKAI